MADPAAAAPVPRATLLAAFGCIYFIWGSTYLAIRFAVETLPPFLMVAGRCLIAGAVLFAWASRGRGPLALTARHWRAAAWTGGLLFAGGQAMLATVERFVDSGLSAVVLATIPVWMILLQLHRKRPGGRTIVGVVLGLGGVALLVVPQAGSGAAVEPLGAALLQLAAVSWAVGSLASRSASLPAGSALPTALQLLAGGAAAALVGVLSGELGELGSAAVSGRSLLAFAYLTVFGTLVTFTAYAWLLNHCEPAVVGSYAFVNPVVALGLGWALGGEELSAGSLAAAAVIVAGVYLVVTTGARRRAARPAPPEPCARLAAEASDTRAA